MSSSHGPAFHFQHMSRSRRRFYELVAAIALFSVASVIGYKVIQDDYSWLDAIYMTVISLSTVGYKEIGELTMTGKIWTIVVIVGGLLIIASMAAIVGQAVVERQIRRVFGRRQLERQIAKLSGHTIICGYGRIGTQVADELQTADHDIVVIETDPDRITAADTAGLLYIRGDAQEESILQSAGIDRASILVVALREDADNLFITLSARQSNPGLRIVARSEQPESQRKLLKAGADSVVCPEQICARRMAGLVLRPGVVELADMARQGLNLEVNQFMVPSGSKLANQELSTLELPRKLGAHVVAIRRGDGQSIYHPRPSTKLAIGDTVVLIGEVGSSEAIEQLLAEHHEGTAR